MKIQVALTVENMIAAGTLDGCARLTMGRDGRTPGPVGISLLRDEVSMSVRDLVVQMLTVSDNAATDELLAIVGLDAVNHTTQELGMSRTRVVSNIGGMLDEMAVEVGYSNYRALAAHDPEVAGEQSEDELGLRLAASSTLDPQRGTRTTAEETVALLQSIWTDRAGPAAACAAVRRTMAQQLLKQRIASAFAPPLTVAAKSGGLAGVVRNEAGVVGYPDGSAYAVAVFTREPPRNPSTPAQIDAAIGRVARTLVDQLRAGRGDTGAVR